MEIKGAICAMITPFIEDRLDEEGLRENIQEQIDAQMDALVFLGTTGEPSSLSSVEKKQILSIAEEEIKGDIPLISCAKGISTQTVLKELQALHSMHVDAALVLPPHYVIPTQKGLVEHFSYLAKNSPIPIILYNSLKRTSVDLSLETLLALEKLPNIIGIKECPANYFSLTKLLSSISLPVLLGDDIWTFPAMMMGASGTVSVAANLLPHKMKEMTEAVFQKNYGKAQSLHNELLPLFWASSIETNPIPIKAAMSYLKKPSGLCRAPLSSLTKEQEQILVDHIKKAIPLCESFV